MYRDNISTVNGKRDDTKIQLDSKWLHYIVWSILAFTISCLVIHTMIANSPSHIAQIVVLIVALIFLYKAVQWINRFYF